MKKIILLLLLSLPAALWAQGTLGFRFDGGVSWMRGGGIEGTAARTRTAIQPQAGAGLVFNFTPAFRLGLDYGYTRMLREQTNASLLPQPDGGVKGDVYRDFRTNFHGAGLTGELDLLGLGGGKAPLSLYVGTGVTCLFASGNSYTIGVSNTIKPDKTGNSIHVTGHNEGHRYVAPCIPATLSLEYLFLPQVALRICGGYRFVLAGRQGISPKGQAYATVGLCFQLMN
ncbi:MAG: hypothetical protein K6G79_05105 [Bacteroidales bacterium]|nr:hypothetical protein [Bacteroidales bacterium]